MPVTRAIAYRYPFLPFRRRLRFLDGPNEAIPHDLIVKTRDGTRIRVEPDGMYHDVFYWGDYEPLNTKVYRRLISPNDTVFDVGANFGWFTAHFARWVGAEGHVHAFEPVPFIFRLVEETLKLNEAGSRVQLNPIALGRHKGTLAITTYSGLPHGHATAVDLGREDGTEHICTLATLDEYCRRREVQQVQFMKVDVEGFELDVFAGAENILTSNIAPIVAFEINPDCLIPRSLTARDVIESLRDSGYTDFYRISIRKGIEHVSTEPFESGDWIAGKPVHRSTMERAVRTNRLTR